MKKLYLLVFFALFGLHLFAQRSLSSYGIPTQILKGTGGSYSYYIRLLPNQQINGSMLSLHYEIPATLNFNKSYIHVSVNDEPTFSGAIIKDSVNRISIPIQSNSGQKDAFLKLTIRAQLFVGDDPCQDENNPSLWLKVLPSTAIKWALNKNYGLAAINLSNTLFTKKAIVYPTNISAGELQTVALTYARLRKAGINDIRLYSQDEMPAQLNDFIYIGLLHKIKPAFRSKIKINPKAGQGLVYLSKTTGLDQVDQVLFLTANDIPGLSKSLDAVLTKGIFEACFQDYLLINKSAYKPYTKTNRLYLSDLEDNNILMTGSGSLYHNFAFKTSAFADLPADLNAEFSIKYTGLEKQDRGYFNIYLNNALISSAQLNESGSLRVSTSVNRYQLKKFNTLRTEFIFHAADGICAGNFRNFIGQVDAKNSYLTVQSKLSEKNLTFFSYPDAFQQEAAILVSKNVLSSSVQAIAKLVSEINDHYSNEIRYRPVVDFADHAEQYAGKNIILISGRKDALLGKFKQIPLKYNQAFAIYDNASNEVIYQLSAPDRSAIAQIFEDEQFPTVLSITIPDEGFSSAALQQTVSNLNEQLNQFSGNTLISNKNNHLIFNLAQNSNNVRYADNGNTVFSLFWEKYKLLLLAGTLFLIFLSYLYVRKKVKQSQNIVTA